MNLRRLTGFARLKSSRAFSLEEVVFSSGVASVAIGGILAGHNLAYQRTAWAEASRMAQNFAVQRLEQVQAAKWDTRAVPALDEVVEANFPEDVQALTSPSFSASLILATNRTTITSVSQDPLVRLVQVDCSWSFMGRQVYTNSVFTYRGPDQ